MSFFDKYINLCNSKIVGGKPISPCAAAEEIGFHRSDVTRWSGGAAPRRASIARIAEYFGVDVSYFDEAEEKTAAQKGDGHIREYSAETGEVRSDIQISLLSALYKVPTRVMAHIMCVNEQRAEALVLRLEEPEQANLQAAADFFELDIKRLLAGWTPLAPSPSVQSKVATLRELVFPYREAHE